MLTLCHLVLMDSLQVTCAKCLGEGTGSERFINSSRFTQASPGQAGIYTQIVGPKSLWFPSCSTSFLAPEFQITRQPGE